MPVPLRGRSTRPGGGIPGTQIAAHNGHRVLFATAGRLGCPPHRRPPPRPASRRARPAPPLRAHHHRPMPTPRCRHRSIYADVYIDRRSRLPTVRGRRRELGVPARVVALRTRLTDPYLEPAVLRLGRVSGDQAVAAAMIDARTSRNVTPRFDDCGRVADPPRSIVRNHGSPKIFTPRLTLFTWTISERPIASSRRVSAARPLRRSRIVRPCRWLTPTPSNVA